MRARNIKPGFYKNADLSECSVWARLLFPGLWMLADREGRLADRPKQIKGEIFPYDNVEIDALLDELVSSKMIIRYNHGEQRFIQIINFDKHQRPHSNEVKSEIPECSEDCGTLATKVGSTSNQGRKCFALNDESPSLNADILNAVSTETGGRKKEDVIPLPHFLNPEAWEDFVQYRKETKKPLTPRATKAILNKLEKFNAEGQDTTEIINESISSGWAGVFPLKNRKNNSHFRSGGNGTGQTKAWTIMPDGRMRKHDGTFWREREDGEIIPA